MLFSQHSRHGTSEILFSQHSKHDTSVGSFETTGNTFLLIVPLIQHYWILKACVQELYFLMNMHIKKKDLAHENGRGCGWTLF